MTLPINQLDSVEAAREIKRHARTTRQAANSQITVCDGGTVPIHALASSFLSTLLDSEVAVISLSAIDGVGSQLEKLFPGKVFNGDTEISNFLSALTTLITFIVGDIPIDSTSGRWIQTLEFDANNRLAQRTTTNPTQIANLKAALITFVSVFDVT